MIEVPPKQRPQAGPVEQMVQVALHPTDTKVMTIRYTWGGDGLLRTTDGGALVFYTMTLATTTVATRVRVSAEPVDG